MDFDGNAMSTSVKYTYFNAESNSAPFIFNWHLNEAVIGDDVEMLYTNFFKLCSGLKKVTLGKNLSLIQKDAFCQNEKLQTLEVHAEEPPYCYPYVFTDTNLEQVILRVPKESLEAYKTTAPWSEFGIIEAIEDKNALDAILPDNGKKQYYTLDGKYSSSSSSSFYIIKNEDGRVMKAVFR